MFPAQSERKRLQSIHQHETPSWVLCIALFCMYVPGLKKSIPKKYFVDRFRIFAKSVQIQPTSYKLVQIAHRL
jgi:hypothetical protein